MVVPFDLFQQTVEELKKEIKQLKSEVSVHSELIPGLSWLNRQQAMKFLNCSSTKLWELAKKNKIVTTTIGSKVMYKTDSIKGYLLSNSTEIQVVNSRLKNIFSNLLDTDSV